MGYMKQLGIQISKYVYEFKLTDDEITKRLQEYPEDWVRAQVKYVREHPKYYKEMHQ